MNKSTHTGNPSKITSSIVWNITWNYLFHSVNIFLVKQSSLVLAYYLIYVCVLSIKVSNQLREHEYVLLPGRTRLAVNALELQRTCKLEEYHYFILTFNQLFFPLRPSFSTLPPHVMSVCFTRSQKIFSLYCQYGKGVECRKKMWKYWNLTGVLTSFPSIFLFSYFLPLGST